MTASVGNLGAASAPTDPVGLVAAHPGVIAFGQALAAGRRVVATGAVGSSPALVAAAVARSHARIVVLVVAHLDDADEIASELEGIVPVERFPALETLPGESAVATEQLAERLRLARLAPTLAGPCVLVCPMPALMQAVPSIAAIEASTRTIKKGQTLRPGDLTAWLASSGYERVDAVEEVAQFAVRGGIIDIFPAAAGTQAPVRLDFFGDELDRLSEIDIGTMATDRAIDTIELLAANAGHATRDDGVQFLDLLPREAVAILVETMEVVEQGRGYYERVTDARGIFGPPAVLRTLELRLAALAELNQFSAGASTADLRIDLPFSALPTFAKELPAAIAELASLAKDADRTLVACQTEAERTRLAELIAEHAPGPAPRIRTEVRYIHRGFTLGPAEAAPGSAGPVLALVPYHELVGRFAARRRAGRVRAGRAMDTFLDFAEGDYVVHQDHGIARFAGLSLMKPRDLPMQVRGIRTSVEGEAAEYLTLEFASKAKLYVPATQIDKVQKYIGGFHGKPPLSTLGGQKWKNQTERVAESVRDLAAELMRVRAAREHLPGQAFPADTTWQSEFEGEFPFEETEDQLAALAEIKRDMQRARPMDRLICGDVGFGKTELAIRAAFKACEFGKQVAVLVPTTVLAEQHERTFKSRFAGYPFRVESVSRFKSDAQVKEVLEALRKGHVDVIIGTHRLLSKDVHFADLGLVIVDEEQRFGVEHKEALLRLRLTVDVLTLSATPIPRTLHMAMLGIRDISSLTTAPVDRRAIVTEVIPWNAARVRQAIERELAREGQVFYVHNRVHDILSKADDIRRLAPGARIVVGHGQMDPHELEAVMVKFVRREADILVSTTIIESGIDIASANTMIIDDADRFGLAELHQLRGRVGRSKHRAYCYLLLPGDRTVKEVAQKRLKAIEQYSMLGAGFKIAMRDLEIRGAGNILGEEQSGHIAAVGYDMYCHLLERTVKELGNEKPPEPPSSTAIEIGASGIIPKAYIPSDQRRLEAYRRLAIAATSEELNRARADLVGAYGEPPSPTVRLIELAELRIAAAALSVRTITIRERDVVIFSKNAEEVGRVVRANGPGMADEATVRVLPPAQPGGLGEVYVRFPENYLEPTTLLAVLRRRLGITKAPQPGRAPAEKARKPTRPR